MFENTIGGSQIPEPLGMHPDFATGPGYGVGIICSETERYVVRWCCRNKCGGIYSITLNRWTIITPITFEDFLEELKTRDFVTTESFDSWEMRRWVKACKLASC